MSDIPTTAELQALFGPELQEVFQQLGKPISLTVPTRTQDSNGDWTTSPGALLTNVGQQCLLLDYVTTPADNVALASGVMRAAPRYSAYLQFVPGVTSRLSEVKVEIDGKAYPLIRVADLGGQQIALQLHLGEAAS